MPTRTLAETHMTDSRFVGLWRFCFFFFCTYAMTNGEMVPHVTQCRALGSWLLTLIKLIASRWELEWKVVGYLLARRWHWAWAESCIGCCASSTCRALRCRSPDWSLCPVPSSSARSVAACCRSAVAAARGPSYFAACAVAAKIKEDFLIINTIINTIKKIHLRRISQLLGKFTSVNPPQ